MMHNLSSLVVSKDVAFDESPILLDRSVCGCVYIYLDGY